jgi:predicted ATPase
VFCRGFAAYALWLLGYPDQALKRSHEALALAQELSHPHSLASTLSHGAMLHHFRREVQTTQERVKVIIALSHEQGFPFWLAMGLIWQGWVLAEQGQGEEGITQMRQGLAAVRATGARQGGPYALTLLAEAYGKVGQACGRAGVARRSAVSGGQNWRALLRSGAVSAERRTPAATRKSKSKGKSQKLKIETDPRSLTPDPHAEAEACFHKAIEVARKQQAKSLELRAIMSLARLWQQQGKKEEARRLLAEVYNWFTEGFDTKDLQEAKALLEEL